MGCGLLPHLAVLEGDRIPSELADMDHPFLPTATCTELPFAVSPFVSSEVKE